MRLGALDSLSLCLPLSRVWSGPLAPLDQGRVGVREGRRAWTLVSMWAGLTGEGSRAGVGESAGTSICDLPLPASLAITAGTGTRRRRHRTVQGAGRQAGRPASQRSQG